MLIDSGFNTINLKQINKYFLISNTITINRLKSHEQKILRVLQTF